MYNRDVSFRSRIDELVNRPACHPLADYDLRYMLLCSLLLFPSNVLHQEMANRKELRGKKANIRHDRLTKVGLSQQIRP